MSLAVADAVDDVRYALCADCADTFALDEGWQGLCPECCALLDDHRDGMHDTSPIATCSGCDVVESDLWLPAIA